MEPYVVDPVSWSKLSYFFLNIPSRRQFQIKNPFYEHFIVFVTGFGYFWCYSFNIFYGYFESCVYWFCNLTWWLSVFNWQVQWWCITWCHRSLCFTWNKIFKQISNVLSVSSPSFLSRNKIKRSLSVMYISNLKINIKGRGQKTWDALTHPLPNRTGV